MKDYWYGALLIFILLHGSSQTNVSQTGSLSCVNDYLTNISCVWWNSTDISARRCELHGVKSRQNARCELLPLNSHSYSPRGCALTFETNFFFLVKVTLKVSCNGSLFTTMHYIPARHIKTQPPDKPDVNGTKVFWSRGVNFPNDIIEYEFQVQFKPGEWEWERADPKLSQRTEIDLPPDILTIGEEYQARVRVKPVESRNEGYFQGEWSDWSPAVSWRSEVGKSPPVLPDDSHTIMIIGVHVLLVIVAISLYKVKKSSGWLKPKSQHVPDPSRFFKPLHTVHGGNFQKWVGCQNSSGPFLNPQSCDDISPVEVSDIWNVSFMDRKATAKLLHSNPVDSGLENSGTSQASSSIFSNMGYFYSKSHSGSMHLETCPVYFTYNPEEDLNSAFSSTSSSYDFLQSPQFQVDHLMSPDSGFHMPEQYEEDRDDDEVCDDGNPLVSFIMSLSQSSLGCVRTAESFPPMPINTPWAEPVSMPNYTSTFEPVEGATVRPSSLIEPCASGYLTLKEMQKYSNKSI
ncbi:interleukin-2 receptor subunit beta isoform X2 [Triplophysa dalaica]|uniref:interleukin-2 receptor subunit beta isoform X2 n=1 Tax=Triplophysa dalaica TaxID=1582913 RepID=UPI0024DFF30D|nr:interleukin-2 receptor subunit beta isoform X2 [Triplophysa dalaica]